MQNLPKADGSVSVSKLINFLPLGAISDLTKGGSTIQKNCVQRILWSSTLTFANCQNPIDFNGIVPVCTAWIFGSASDCTTFVLVWFFSLI